MKYSLITKFNLIPFLIVILSFWSCEDDEVPEGILTEDEMVPIMLDVYLAEGKVNELRVKRDSALIIFEVYEAKILEKYDLNDSVYTNSLRYYYENPLRLERVYETVLDSLNLLEKRLDEAKEDVEETNPVDSLDVKPEKVVGV